MTVSRRLEFADAVEAMEAYAANGWTDGLPIVPPTEKRVQRFLAVAGLDPEDVVGTSAPRRRTATAEKVAINAVMAGCEPQHFPVVVAAVRAMCSGEYALHGPAASMAGSAPLAIVSGPDAEALGFNSGLNPLGPGTRANATVGRALRLVLINVFAAGSPEFERSMFGHPGKYSYCVAESPERGRWPWLHEQFGHDAADTCVTLLWAMAPQQRVVYGPDTATLLEPVARDIARAPASGAQWSYGYWTVVLTRRLHARLDAAGWTRADVADFLCRRSSRTLGELKRESYVHEPSEPGDDEIELRAVPDPDHLLTVVAGSAPIEAALVIPPYSWNRSYLTKPVTVPVRPMPRS